MMKMVELVEDAVKKNPSMDRAFLSIEYKEWDKADTLLEAVLDEEPRNAIAYLGKVMIAERVSDLESLTDISEATKASPDYQRMVRFADDNVKAVLNAIEEKKQEREKEEEARKQETLKEADGLSLSTKEEELKRAVSLYRSLDGWSDSEGKAQKTEKRLQDLQTVYVKMINRFNASATEEDYLEVVKYLQPVGEYKHAKQIAAEAEKRAKAYREGQRIYRADVLLRRGDLASLKEAESLYASIEGQEEKLSECRKRIEAYCTLQYSEALRLMAEGTEYSYTRAIQALNRIPDWRDSGDLIKRCERSIEDLKEKEREEQERRERELAKKEETKESNELEEKNTPENTDESVEEIEEGEKEEKRTVKDNKKSSKTKVVLLMIGLLLIIGGGLLYCFVTPLHNYLYGRLLFSTGKYEEAITQFELIGDYRDSDNLRIDSLYQYGLQLMERQEYQEARSQFRIISEQKDCSVEIEKCDREIALFEFDQYLETGAIKDILGAYKKLKAIDEDEASRRMCPIILTVIGEIEKGSDITFADKTEIGGIILKGIERPEIKEIIKKHPAASFSLISYYDYRYADVALYYGNQSNDILSPDINLDLQLMSAWSGSWIADSMNGFQNDVHFSVLADGLSTSVSERILKKVDIDSADLYHLSFIWNASFQKNDGSRGAYKVFYEVVRVDDEVVITQRETLWGGQSTTRYHRIKSSKMIDVSETVETVNNW